MVFKAYFNITNYSVTVHQYTDTDISITINQQNKITESEQQTRESDYILSWHLTTWLDKRNKIDYHQHHQLNKIKYNMMASVLYVHVQLYTIC